MLSHDRQKHRSPFWCFRCAGAFPGASSLLSLHSNCHSGCSHRYPERFLRHLGCSLCHPGLEPGSPWERYKIPDRPTGVRDDGKEERVWNDGKADQRDGKHKELAARTREMICTDMSKPPPLRLAPDSAYNRLHPTARPDLRPSFRLVIDAVGPECRAVFPLVVRHSPNFATVCAFQR